MKQWIQQHYPEKMSYDRLRKAIREAWEKAIAEEYLNELLDTMQKRCEDVYLPESTSTSNVPLFWVITKFS
jgi:hypothetical protein